MRNRNVTNGGGLNKLSAGQFTVFGKPQGLPSNIILSIHEDRHGSLWVGTRNGGLAQVDRGIHQQFLRGYRPRALGSDAENLLRVLLAGPDPIGADTHPIPAFGDVHED